MTKTLKVLFLGATFLLTAHAFSQTDDKPNEKKKIPFATVKTMSNENFNTSKIDNKGKPIVIVVWETFKRSCYQYFQALNEDLDEWEHETGVKIIIISIDPPRSAPDVLPMVQAKQWDFDSYIDVNREFKTAMGVVATPYTFIINDKKEVVWEKQGYAPGLEGEVYELIKKVAKGEKIEKQ